MSNSAAAAGVVAIAAEVAVAGVAMTADATIVPGDTSPDGSVTDRRKLRL
jgi:hypothetical protein